MRNQLSHLHAALRGERTSAAVYTSPNDVSYQIALMLTIILSISVLLVTTQANALQDIERTVQSWDEPKQQLIVDLRREQLFRKIRAVLDAYESAWRLAEYPSARSVPVRQGFPADDGFKTLCTHAVPFLSGDADAAVKKLYEEALRTGEPVLFDAVVFPEAAVGSSTPAVLGDSREDSALREDALQLVRGCCGSWRAALQKVQTDLLLGYLATPDSRVHDDAQKAQTKENLVQHFASNNYPLLDGVFSPLAPSAIGKKSP